MIKQLERRFTIIAITAFGMVLLTLLILVNVISMNANIRRADEALMRLSDDLSAVRLDEPERLPNIEGKDQDHRSFFKEENRSFEVVVESDSLALISTNASYRNIIDNESAYDMTLALIKEGEVNGFVDEFRYLVVDEQGTSKVIFLDYSIEKASEQNFIYISITVFFIALVLTSLLVMVMLKPVMKSIKESYSKQKQFITDASHELKTPLTVIATNMEIIEMDNGGSDWIDSVNSHVKRLNTLTNELVTLSRMDEEGVRIELVEVGLSDIVNDVVMGFEPAFQAKSKDLELAIEEGIKIKGDYDALERVLSVLLNNALKYSNDKGTIRVDLHTKGKKVVLSVSNSVDTIEKGPHTEYFERFYRSDASRNSETGGFGIGLAVAKATIEEHKGKIEASSKDGHSLEVKITLKA